MAAAPGLIFKNTPSASSLPQQVLAEEVAVVGRALSLSGCFGLADFRGLSIHKGSRSPSFRGRCHQHLGEGGTGPAAAGRGPEWEGRLVSACCRPVAGWASQSIPASPFLSLFRTSSGTYVPPPPCTMSLLSWELEKGYARDQSVKQHLAPVCINARVAFLR